MKNKRFFGKRALAFLTAAVTAFGSLQLVGLAGESHAIADRMTEAMVQSYGDEMAEPRQSGATESNDGSLDAAATEQENTDSTDSADVEGSFSGENASKNISSEGASGGDGSGFGSRTGENIEENARENDLAENQNQVSDGESGSGSGEKNGDERGSGFGGRTGDETGSESGGENGAGTEASPGESQELKQLCAKREEMEVIVSMQDGSCFADGMYLELLTVDEMFPEDTADFAKLLYEAGIDAAAADYMELHPGDWNQEQTELLEKQIEDSVTGHLIYYLRAADASGNEVELKDTVTELCIRDKDLYRAAADETVAFSVTRHSQDREYETEPDEKKPETTLSEEEETVSFRISPSDLGWVQVLALDEERLSEFSAGETKDQLETESLAESENEQETEPGADLVDGEVLEETLEEAEGLEAEEFLSLAALDDMTPEGTRVTASGTGYTIVNPGDRTYSYKYCSIKAHTNSAVIPWNNAGTGVKSGSFASGSVRYGTYFLPQNKEAAGKFGYRVTNVAYNDTAKCNLDLLVTVVNYNNYTYSSSGKKVSGIYPFLGMFITEDGNIGFAFYNAFPMMEVKCDLVQSGTMTPVSGNYRMKMLDIDYWQRFGISIQNGSVENKYAQSGSVVYTKNTNIFGHSYLQFNGCGDAGINNPAQTVVYELGNTSGIYLLFLPEYRTEQTTTSEATINRRYNEAVKGTVDTHGILEWDGSPYGPIETAVPAKYVSNDGSSLGVSNELPGTSSEYYYTIDHFVPEESSAYYYSEYNVLDTLPAGVDYAGSWSAVQLESGANVSGWFAASVGADLKNIQLSAIPGALASSGFYGFHYRFTIKVKMSSGQISPVYSENTAFYTVRNTAEVSIRHLSGSNAVTKQTNTVTTTARETRIEPEVPYKRVECEEELIRKIYEDTGETVVFSIYQKIPREPAAWLPARITMTDVLEDCLDYETCEVSFRAEADSSFTEVDGWENGCHGQSITSTREYDPSFAGGTLRWDITCRIAEGANLDGWHKVVDGKTWIYIPDVANIKFDWNQGVPKSLEKNTNEAAAMFPVPEVGITLRKVNADTGEYIEDAVFTIYEWDGSGYSVERKIMDYDKENKVYIARNLDRTNANEGKFKVVETVTPRGFFGVWEKEITVPEEGREELEFIAENPMAKGTITIYKKSKRKGELLEGSEYEIKANKDVVSPQGMVLVKAGAIVDVVTTASDGRAVSKELYPGEYCITETKAPLGYDLDARPQMISVPYKDRDTAVTNVETSFANDRLYSVIRLTKEIDAADIVWAHGNPTFTFRVEGEDVLGVSHTYFETVEFTEQETSGEGKVKLSTELRVLAGDYIVSEEKTMRYSLADIHDVSGGSILSGGNGVQFNLSKGENAAAVFYNVKTTDEDESHSTFVRNHIVE